MRRTLQRGARARLSFPGEPHASVNMTNSRQLPVGRLFLVPRKRGDESPEELLRFSKTWRTKCSAVQRIKRTISGVFIRRRSLLPYYPPCLQKRVALQMS